MSGEDEGEGRDEAPAQFEGHRMVGGLWYDVAMPTSWLREDLVGYPDVVVFEDATGALELRDVAEMEQQARATEDADGRES